MAGGDGAAAPKQGSSGVDKKKLHHLNPRRRTKLKQKLPEKRLTEEEKHRRAEQKKRRVRAVASAVALLAHHCSQRGRLGAVGACESDHVATEAL